MDSNEAKKTETWAHQFYGKQIDILRAKKVEELIGSHYHSDATLISFEKTVWGNRNFKLRFHDYLGRPGNLENLSLDSFAESPDSPLFEALVLTNLGRLTVFDAFVVGDGKATHHFTGVK